MKHIELKTTESKVHAVTVFQADRAEVVRLCSVDLTAGQNEVEISQLPTVLDEDSIRVDGIGGNAVISDVIYHPPASNDSDKKHELAVKDLQKAKTALEQQLEICKKQASILETYAGTLKGADTTGTKMNEFLDIYSERQASIDVRTTDLNEQIQAVEEQIKKEKEIWNADDESKKRAVRVTVVVYAENDGPAEISLTYLVSNASWTPLYDLRAVVGAEKTSISLQYRATIVQRTGEDWGDVKLTLSTASPQLGSAIPTLQPLWINAINPYRRMVKSAKKGGFGGGGSRMSAPVARLDPNMAAMLGGGGIESSGGSAFVHQDAVAMEGAMSTSYIIEGLSTIPSDTDATSQAHKVTVAVVDLTADLEWIAVPKEQPSAFLRARVKNTSQYLFLPGRANIFLDDNFVAKSEIEHVSPNETFNCSLGVDPQVKVTYHPRTKKSRLQGGLLSTRTTTTASHQKITVKNNRGTAIPRLLVREQVPVSHDERLKVTLIDPASIEFPNRNTISAGSFKPDKAAGVLKPVRLSKGVTVRWKVNDDEDAEGEADGTAGADGAREGILEWICEIGSGQSTDLNLAWEVTAPSGLNWGPQ
ncbi:hypothetical protein M408DRAFT_185309 [Serendipita vermifera MAFF 305830]|uniref:Mucoidy inhibitor A n=1 Tax=Serendipita vermifera MAFF 305830 TaxID=933852 RepID=A0A0C2X398_SERVB|nr:hypothetical protein M408DRAFT_185309 [Serendipita vermifera MAFF 305830]